MDTLPYEYHTKTLLGMRRYREALLICRKWVQNQPDNPNAWFFKGFSEMNAHFPNTALESVERALSLNPDNLLIRGLQAEVLAVIGRTTDSLEIVGKILQVENLHPGLAYQVGNTLSNIGQHRRAVELFRKVRDAEPDNVDNLVSLGTALHILDESDEAEQLHLEALKLNPENFRGYWLLGQLKRAKPDANHIDFFRGVLEQHSGRLQARICLNFALAKQYEEIEDFDAAFEHLEKGSAAVLEHTPYDASTDLQLAVSARQAFDHAFFEAPPQGFPTNEPIFILGMPRTGTTLLEQIITTYEGIETAGELHHFNHLVNAESVAHNGRVSAKNAYDNVAQFDWHKLGSDYIDRARVHVPDSERFIDKYPLNFMMAGPILTALPDARIINLQRNPMDTCFSNYKLLYRLGSALHTYDLQTMGEYYCLYESLMAHWREVLPGNILDVQYEALVMDPENETRRVAEFLGLEWDPKCLEFYKSGGAVATASSAQVRRPIYKDSLYKWRKFERHLQPLAELFDKRGIQYQNPGV